MKVAILGASDRPDRFAYKAFKSLRAYDHSVVLVNPNLDEVEGEKVFKKLTDIKEPIDTLTMYVGPKISSALTDDILALHPRRVIFNPGSENPELEKTLVKNGIKTLEACTLVLLNVGQFESN